MSTAVGLTIAGAVAVAALVLAEAREARVAKAVTKALASLAFVAVALARGALDHGWSTSLLVGLGFALVGDLCLLSHARRAFLAGLGAFLVGHALYAVAFGQRGLDATGALVAAPAVAIALVVVGRWLLPHVDGAMRGPVLAYMAVISIMVVTAAATFAHARSWPLLVGAVAFYLSDLAVARDRFVAPGLVNRLWGLPLYYGAQLVLAWSA